MASSPLSPADREVALFNPGAPAGGAPAMDDHPHRLDEPPEEERQSWRKRLKSLRYFTLLVLLPTALVALFAYVVLADQYESETHFVVRRSGESAGPSSSLGQFLGMSGNQTVADSQTVVDYLMSHDAVAVLDRSLGLASMFRRPEADMVSRLAADAPPETLLRYYRDMVHAETGHEGGITRVTVRAYRPVDAQRIAQALVVIGEKRVNAFNQRVMNDSLAVARQSLEAAERGVRESQAALTGFRQSERDIDPERTGTARIGMATELQGELARARARLSSVAGTLSPRSPQYMAMAARVRALEQQVAAAQASLAGPSRATAVGLGRYEGLRLKQEFAAKRFEAAAGAMEAARQQAMHQQLFLVHIVEPNLPAKPLYPKRLKLIATVFFALLLLYAIGWLIFAGLREHAA